MKSTGIIRKVDELGRVVIPIEIRNQFDIKEKDPIEIFVEGGLIVLKKFNPNCIFCGNEKDLIEHNKHLICKECIEKICNTNMNQDKNEEIKQHKKQNKNKGK